MNKEKLKIWGLYLLLAILTVLVLEVTKSYKSGILFWIFIGLGGISSLLVRWFGFNDLPKNINIARHITIVFALSMFLFWIVIVLCEKCNYCLLDVIFSMFEM